MISGKIEAVIRRQMNKSGGTIFTVRQVQVAVDPHCHITAAVLNDLRREAFDGHILRRLDRHVRIETPRQVNEEPWPADEQTSLVNITNRQARAFFLRHGVLESTLDLIGRQEEDAILMTCKYCLKRQLEICPRDNRTTAKLLDPLYLSDNTGSYELQCDCSRCEMRVLGRKNHRI